MQDLLAYLQVKFPGMHLTSELTTLSNAVVKKFETDTGYKVVIYDHGNSCVVDSRSHDFYITVEDGERSGRSPFIYRVNLLPPVVARLPDERLAYEEAWFKMVTTQLLQLAYIAAFELSYITRYTNGLAEADPKLGTIVKHLNPTINPIVIEMIENVLAGELLVDGCLFDPTLNDLVTAGVNLLDRNQLVLTGTLFVTRYHKIEGEHGSYIFVPMLVEPTKLNFEGDYTLASYLDKAMV